MKQALLKRLLLDLPPTGSNGGPQILQRPRASVESRELVAIPVTELQRPRGLGEELRRHPRDLKIDAGSLLHERGNADAGRVKVESGVKDKTGRQGCQALDQLTLGRRRTAGHVNDNPVLLGKYRQRPESLGILHKDRAVGLVGNCEINLGYRRSPDPPLRMCQGPSNPELTIKGVDNLLERLTNKFGQ